MVEEVEENNMAREESKEKVVALNRKASHDYFLEERYECGIALTGTEIKSVRTGKVQFKDAFISIYKGEAWIKGMHISPYKYGNIFNVDSKRVRKLLMHKKEILKLFGQSKQQGFSIIPISIYFKGSNVKVQVGLCKGKKLYDKREDMAKKSAQRTMERALKDLSRY